MESPELKPCPFCGSDAYIRKNRDLFSPNCYFGSCENIDCYASTGGSFDKELAVQLWNKRVTKEV